MADATIATGQLGAYELPLAANTVTTVAIDGKDFMEVLVHSGGAPVYAKVADTVLVKDPTSTMLPVGGFGIVRGHGKVLALISAQAAVVSVARPTA